MRKKRILIAEGNIPFLETLLKSKEARSYEICAVTTGPECLDKMRAFLPELLFVDLMLPKMHGIEVLKEIRKHPETEHFGVIITSEEPMIQNHHAALTEGATYFLAKPCTPQELFALADTFFKGALNPAPFIGQSSSASSSKKISDLPTPKNYIKFWGTRGSNAVSGPDYVRFGGNTCCIEIRYGKDRCIIDAGTGIRPLGDLLEIEQEEHIHLILSHTHWDHVAGFPFFHPIYDTAHKLTIFSPVGYEKNTHDLFEDMFAYAYFPVRLDDIQARITFQDIRDGDKIQIGTMRIEAHYAYHPGPTLCFKIYAGDHIIGYTTDNEVLLGYHGPVKDIVDGHPLLEPHLSQIAFFQDCTLWIHEAQYTPAEYKNKVGWGHSSITNASILASHCKIKSWIVTHHDPSHTDEILLKKAQLHQDILSSNHIDCHIQLAFDGLCIPL